MSSLRLSHPPNTVSTGRSVARARPAAVGSIRRVWVVVHRWAGLTIALFLVVAGLTGAILPWHEELTLASRPSLSQAAPATPRQRPLDAPTLAARAEAQLGARVTYLPLTVPTDRVLQVYVAPAPGESDLRVAWIDPYSGHVRLLYRYAVLRDGVQNMVPFLYTLHYGWALGAWGMWAFGVAALVWTLDCVVGLYLTLPVRRHPLPGAAPHRAGWWARWRPAWIVRRHARGHKLSFDLHRAGGLWLWPLLFVFAWSAVGLTLPQVQHPVMRLFGGTEMTYPTALAAPLDRPALGFAAAATTGRRLMARQARQESFTVERDEGLYYVPAYGSYWYSALTSLDRGETGRTQLWFSGADGHPIGFRGPLGASAADATTSWFDLLHMAQVFGLPYRIFVSLFGLLVAALSVTGVLIWMKKRAARLLGNERRQAPIATLQPIAAE